MAQTTPWKKKRKWRPKVLMMVGTMEERSTMVQPRTSWAIEAPMFLWWTVWMLLRSYYILWMLMALDIILDFVRWYSIAFEHS